MSKKLFEQIKGGAFANAIDSGSAISRRLPTKDKVEWLAEFFIANYDEFDKKLPKGSTLWHLYHTKFGPENSRDISGRVLYNAVATLLSVGQHNSELVEQ